eukprot:gene4137-5177_t
MDGGGGSGTTSSRSKRGRNNYTTSSSSTSTTTTSQPLFEIEEYVDVKRESAIEWQDSGKPLSSKTPSNKKKTTKRKSSKTALINFEQYNLGKRQPSDSNSRKKKSQLNNVNDTDNIENQLESLSSTPPKDNVKVINQIEPDDLEYTIESMKNQMFEMEENRKKQLEHQIHSLDDVDIPEFLKHSLVGSGGKLRDLVDMDLDISKLLQQQHKEDDNVINNKEIEEEQSTLVNVALKNMEETLENTTLIDMETELELSTLESQLSQYYSTINEVGSTNNTSAIRRVMAYFKEDFHPGLKKDIESIKMTSNTPSGVWKQVLANVEIEKLCAITLSQILSALVVASVNRRMGQLFEAIGQLVFAEYSSKHLKFSNPNEYEKILKSKSHLPLSRLINMKFQNVVVLLPDQAEHIKKIGAFLVKSAMTHCTITENLQLETSESNPAVSAFFVDSVYEKGLKHTYIKAHKNVLGMVKTGQQKAELYGTSFLPMVIPPQPWINPFNGAYLHIPTTVMRIHGSKLQLDSLMYADLSNIYLGLNILGSTAWVINQKVHNVIKKIWESGGGIGDIISRKDFLLPELPEDYDDNPVSRREFLAKEKKVNWANYNLHSQRCDIELKLGVAQQFSDKTFYFPHNIDFRGRAYPIPPHLNHLGSDFCRSLLKFEEHKPLGERGLFWLKVHISNLYGNDKVTREERHKFTDEHMDDIYDSVDNPLDGKCWWKTADKPFQFLAACFELVDAIRSGNPHEFQSNLPIHQDGTCNGLQHYAALGGDVWGATKVNVLPSDTPQDVYSGVAGLVKEVVEKDVKLGNPIAIKVVNLIDRKTVKPTVMTSVYGITFIGARKQIESALLDKVTLSDQEAFDCSTYLAKIIFSSLNTMFAGARSIMSWLANCAHLIAKKGDHVSWVSPLGLPILQPYNKGNKYNIHTLETDFLMIRDDLKFDVNSVRQKSAFPPNYIHSLDSTHMFLTAISCYDKNITYSAVHDSFWTHASTIDDMNIILRNEFAELHKQPLLERLLEWFKAKYPTINFPPIPDKGVLDLDKVKDSDYFFH